MDKNIIEDTFLELKEKCFADLDELDIEVLMEDGIWYVLVEDHTYEIDAIDAHTEWVMVETTEFIDFERLA